MKELGARVARLRGEKKLTISTLGSLADVSPGLISQVERGQGNPSYTTLVKLARALQVPINTFFSGEDVDARFGVVRSAARRRLVMGVGDIEYELLTPSLQGRLAMYMTRIPPHWTNEHVPSQHEGEECALILEGELLLSVGGREHHLLPGDSLTWDAMEPHWSRNPTDQVTIGLKSATPPTF
jgi:transcriptional regulator with XRE-family HTH domain